VLAASGLVLVCKSDTADARSSAQISARLQDLVRELRRSPREPTPLDAIMARRDERLRANGNGNGDNGSRRW
jgi:hypothetical protein